MYVFDIVHAINAVTLYTLDLNPVIKGRLPVYTTPRKGGRLAGKSFSSSWPNCAGVGEGNFSEDQLVICRRTSSLATCYCKSIGSDFGRSG